MKLVALKNFRYDAKNIRRGEIFEATNTYGRILVARKSASVHKEEKPKRAYHRRDMEAEQTTNLSAEET